MAIPHADNPDLPGLAQLIGERRAIFLLTGGSLSSGTKDQVVLSICTRPE
jgi:hypothetical protein